MAELSWLPDSLAALMLAMSAYCLFRLTLSWRQHRSTDRQVDGVHVLMGVAMAGMLVPGLQVLRAGVWEIVFGASAVLFSWRMVSDARAKARSGHHFQHVLACGAMVYMLAAAASAKAASNGLAVSGMAGSAAHVRTLALVLALGLFGYVVWTADRISSLAPVAALVPSGRVRVAARAGTPLSPRLAACCEIAMDVTMGYMLITML
jgi:Domain of unknown function (DUF5134)